MRAQDVVITEPVRTPPIQRGLFAAVRLKFDERSFEFLGLGDR